LIAIVSVLLPLSNAMYLSVIGPTTATLNNGATIYLGKVGPGESFYVLAQSSTTNATGYVVNIGWDQLNATNLPQGWTTQASPLYENPMKIKVTVPPNANYGLYNITLHAVNVQNYSRLGSITVTAQVDVSPNVFSLSVQPKSISSGPGQPTNLYVTINNTGISDDPFNISAVGLPAWNVADDVVALHSTKSTYVYPVYVNEPGTYSFNLTVGSTTNPALHLSQHINMTASESLLNDYRSVGQGVVLSPVIFDPSYELMLFLSYIYKLVIH
ncbi:MAG: hypothetical protein KGH62_01570, partial [Candidatus Micrarchaeota archaeon]|nr:hypothetical protein [Candidatus Micrarchaeota archaeon]